MTAQTLHTDRSGPTQAVVEHKGNGIRPGWFLGILAMFVDSYEGCIEIFFESR